MTPPAIYRIGLGLTALLLLGQTGCLSFCHPIEPASAENVTACKEIPQPCRNHVYVFFIHGVDPLDFADLSGVRDYVHTLGFCKTYYGQLYHQDYFTSEIRKVHARDPEARFILVGFSFGANAVRDVANYVRSDDVNIDLIVYLGGNTLTNSEEDRPANVARIVNILATGWIWHGAVIDSAENLNYDDVWHFGSPSHPQTLEMLARELQTVAGRVPFAESIYPPIYPEPTPRPTVKQTESRDDWDFLLSGHAAPALTPKAKPAPTPSRNPKATALVE